MCVRAPIYMCVCVRVCAWHRSRAQAPEESPSIGAIHPQGRTSCTQERHQWVSLPSDPACWGLPQCVTPSRALAGGA